MLLVVQQVCRLRLHALSVDHVEDLVSAFLVVQWTRHRVLLKQLATQHFGLLLKLVLTSVTVEPPLSARDLQQMMEDATKSGTLEALQQLETYAPSEVQKHTWHLVEMATSHGHQRLVEWLLARDQSRVGTLLTVAAAKGHVELVQWLCDRQLYGEPQMAIENAALCGHLEIIQYLFDTLRSQVDCVECVVEQAVMGGHFDIVKWLEARQEVQDQRIRQQHTNCGSCSSRTMIGLGIRGAVDKLFSRGFVRMLVKNDDVSPLLDTPQQTQGTSSDRPRRERSLLAMSQEAVVRNQSLLRQLVETGRIQAYEWLLTRNPRLQLFKWFLMYASELGDLELVESLFAHEDRYSEIPSQKGTSNYFQSSQPLALPDEHLPAFKFLLRNGVVSYFQTCLQLALRNGHLAVVEFWLRNRVYPESLIEAVANGQVELVNVLLEKYEGASWCKTDGVEVAAQRGHLEMIKYVDPKCSASYSEECVYEAASSGNVPMLRFLVKQHRRMATWHEALARSIQTGQVDSVKLIYRYIKVLQGPKWKQAIEDAISSLMKGSTKTFTLEDVLKPLNSAACFGHFRVIAFLLSKESPRQCFLATVIQEATRKRQYSLVKLLHEKEAYGFTTDTMDTAASVGSLRLVRFLHENRQEGCTTKAMDQAASGGYLSVVRFLHEHRQEGCTTNAMDHAASNGRLSMVKFLHENRSEGCTTKAMDGACYGGHLDVVRFLHANRREGCSSEALSTAVRCNRLEVVQFLLTHCNKPGDPQLALTLASEAGHLEMVRWIVDSGFAVDLDQALERTTRFDFGGGRQLARNHQVIEYLTAYLSLTRAAPQ